MTVKHLFLLAFLAAILGCSSATDEAKGDDKKPASKDNEKEKLDDTKRPVVVMETNYGTVKIELIPEKAPITVKNFLQYVDDKFYDGLIFHRVIETFMIQGGGFEPGMREKKTRDPIKNESGNGLSNVRGSIAMARTQVLDSATAQFYINVKDNSRSLDQPRYCVFGKVIEGMDVVDKIKAVETGSKGGHDDVPVKDVVIKSIRRGQ